MGILSLITRKATTEIQQAVEVRKIPAESMVKSQAYENPFFKECITDVNIFYRKWWSTDPTPIAKLYIKFKNGPTSGEHKIEGPTIEDVLEKAAEFIKTL